MPFDFNFINIKSSIINSFNNIKTKYIFLKEKKLRIIYTMEPNLGRLLVHNFKLNYDNLKLFHFSSCFDLNCKTCIFADSGYFIKFNEYLLTSKKLSKNKLRGTFFKNRTKSKIGKIIFSIFKFLILFSDSSYLN